MNPAVAGSEEFADFKIGYRNQWTGFTGAPKTMYISGHTDFGRRVTRVKSSFVKGGFHGVGGIITNDVIGATTNLNVKGAYSYHLTIAKKVYASFGVSVGWQQYTLDASMLDPAQSNDVMLASTSKAGMGDLGLGAWLYSKHFFAGLSMTQTATQLVLSQSNKLMKYSLSRHYYGIGGGRFPMSKYFTFIPSACIKGVVGAPISFDVNSKIRYKEMVWAALSYRVTDAVAFLAGVTLNKQFDFSYSYDFITSDISKFTSTGGSHEIVIGYRLGAKDKVYSPSDFW